jgi:chaperone BCS1
MPVDISRQSNGSSATANASLAGGEFLPISGAAFISSLLSISAMVQWLKLLVLGGIFEACRRGLLRLYRFFLDYLFITVDIADTDPCYSESPYSSIFLQLGHLYWLNYLDWVMVWLATQPSWNNARNIELGSEVTDLSGYQIIITNRGRSQRVVSTGERKLTFKPSHSSCHSFWFRRRWVRINRWEKEGTQLYRQKEEFLRLRCALNEQLVTVLWLILVLAHLSILSRDHQSLNALLEEAEAVYKSAQENTISIYVSDS